MKIDTNYFFNEAYKEALKAYIKDEIPVGVVIVKNNKIIARAHNLRDSKKIVTKHAEIIAIEKANIKEKNWRLLDCDLYSTLEPCNMCKEIIKEAKIRNVYFAAKSNNNASVKENSNFIKIQDNDLEKKCSEIIVKKFTELRLK